MRYVPIPDPVTILNPFTDEPVAKSAEDDTPDGPMTMRRYTVTFILADKEMPKGAKGAKMSKRIQKMVKTVPPKTESGRRYYAPIESTDWEAVKKILEAPGNEWNHVITGQCDDFLNAWLDAKEEKPSAEEGVVWGEEETQIRAETDAA